jgi:hypothetical protein
MTSKDTFLRNALIREISQDVRVGGCMGQLQNFLLVSYLHGVVQRA